MSKIRSIDWELLPSFLAVARAGSLRAGAELLNTNYGTVNRNVKALETSYGVALFRRTKRGFVLTEAGDALLSLAEEAEEKVLTARRRVEGLDKSETGNIRFSVTPTLAYDIVAPIIGRFHVEYPDIQIEVRLTTETDDINSNKADISLRAAYEITEDVIARRLYPIAVGIYASATYIKTVLPKGGPEGEGLDWLGWPDEGHSRNWEPPKLFPKARRRHFVADGHMRVQMIRHNCGMSPMPVFFGSLYPDLRQVPGTEVTLNRYLWVILHTDLRRTVRVRRFVDFLTEELLEMRDVIQADVSRPSKPSHTVVTPGLYAS